jgi:DNA-binding transcriptional ArsR family regulator
MNIHFYFSLNLNGLMMNRLNIFGESLRQRILELLGDMELLAEEIATNLNYISFGVVFQHLKVLVEGGLVEVRKGGRNRIYTSNKKDMVQLEDYLTEFCREGLDQLKIKAESIERKRRKLK